MAKLQSPVPLWKKNVPWEVLGPSHLLLGPGMLPFSQVTSFYSIGVLVTTGLSQLLGGSQTRVWVPA